MNFRELVDKRESCRAYTGGMVERNDLDAILRAGCMSPSAKNTQPWKFYVVQYEKKEVLCEAIKVMGFNKFVAYATDWTFFKSFQHQRSLYFIQNIANPAERGWDLPH